MSVIALLQKGGVMKKFLVVLALPLAMFIVACGGSSPTGPGPVPTVIPTDPPAPTVTGFKVWRSGADCQVLPNPACEVSVVKTGTSTFEVTTTGGGYFEGYANFTGPCEITGQYWSDPAESLLEKGEEPVEVLMAPIQKAGAGMFAKGIFRGRGPEDPRYADPAVLRIRTACGGNRLDADLVVHRK